MYFTGFLIAKCYVIFNVYFDYCILMLAIIYYFHTVFKNYKHSFCLVQRGGGGLQPKKTERYRKFQIWDWFFSGFFLFFFGFFRFFHFGQF